MYVYVQIKLIIIINIGLMKGYGRTNYIRLLIEFLTFDLYNKTVRITNSSWGFVGQVFYYNPYDKIYLNRSERYNQWVWQGSNIY